MLNAAPIAVDDDYGTVVDHSIQFDPTSNDTDEDDDALEVVGILGNPQYGDLTWNPDGTFTYDPNGSVGTDTIDYIVSDGHGHESQASFTISVSPRNTAPEVTAAEPISQGELANDETDPAGWPVTDLIASFGAEVHDDEQAGEELGMAIVGFDDAGLGTWQYLIDGGTSWSAFLEWSEGEAFLLDQNAQLRFLPNGTGVGTATLSFYAWDGTAGENGTIADASIRGDASAFSLAACELTCDVVDPTEEEDPPGENSAPRIIFPNVASADLAFDEGHWGELITVVAEDDDDDPIAWSLEGNDADSFTIDSLTGELTLNEPLPIGEYAFEIVACDGQEEDRVEATVVISPTAPFELSVTTLGMDDPTAQLFLTWVNRGDGYDELRLYISDDGDEYELLETFTNGETEFTDESLQPEQLRHYRLIGIVDGIASAPADIEGQTDPQVVYEPTLQLNVGPGVDVPIDEDWVLAYGEVWSIEHDGSPEDELDLLVTSGALGTLFEGTGTRSALAAESPTYHPFEFGPDEITISVRRAGEADWADVQTFSITVYEEWTEDEPWEETRVEDESYSVDFTPAADDFELDHDGCAPADANLLDNDGPVVVTHEWTEVYESGITVHTYRRYEPDGEGILVASEDFPDESTSESFSETVDDAEIVQTVTVDSEADGPVHATAWEVHEDGIFVYQQLADSPAELQADGFGVVVTLTVNVSGFSFEESFSTDVTLNIPGNTPPVITSPEAESRFDISEGSPDVIVTGQATDTDLGDQIVWSLEGDDAAEFVLDPDTHEVSASSDTPPGLYVLDFVATDLFGDYDSRTLTIGITPLAPNQVTVTRTPGSEATSLTVGWTNRSSNYTGVNIEYRVNGGETVNWGQVTDAGNAIEIVGLSPGDTAEVSLQSYLGELEDADSLCSDWTDVAGATTDAPPTISSPDEDDEFSTSEGSAGVILTGVADDDDLDEGDLIRWSLEGDDATSFNIDPDTGAVTLAVGTAPGRYSITLVATDSFDVFDSRAVTVDVAPSAPKNLTVEQDSNGNLQSDLTLSWTDESPGEDGYEIFAADEDADEAYESIGTTSADVTIFTEVGLLPATHRYYRVVAFKGVAAGRLDSDWIGGDGHTAPAITTPAVDGMTVAWTGSYQVIGAADHESAVWEIDDERFQIDANGLVTLVDLLDSETDYSLTIALEDDFGRDERMITFRTAAIDAPAEFNAEPDGVDPESAIAISWSYPSAYDDFEFEVSGDGDTWTMLAPITANDSSYVESGLSPEQTRHYRLRGIVDGVASPWAESNATTEPEVPNTPPRLTVPTANPYSLDLEEGVDGLILIAAAEDDDAGDELTWSIDEADGPHFEIDSAGQVTTAGPLGAGEYSFEIVVTDLEGATASITVNVAVKPAVPTDLDQIPTSTVTDENAPWTTLTFAWTNASDQADRIRIETASSQNGPYTLFDLVDVPEYEGEQEIAITGLADGATRWVRIRAEHTATGLVSSWVVDSGTTRLEPSLTTPASPSITENDSRTLDLLVSPDFDGEESLDFYASLGETADAAFTFEGTVESDFSFTGTLDELQDAWEAASFDVGEPSVLDVAVKIRRSGQAAWAEVKTIHVLVTPAAPSGFDVQPGPQATTQLLLSWTDITTTGDGVLIEASENGLQWADWSDTVELGAQGYLFSDAATGTTTHFRIRSYHSASGTYSDWVSADGTTVQAEPSISIAPTPSIEIGSGLDGLGLSVQYVNTNDALELDVSSPDIAGLSIHAVGTADELNTLLNETLIDGFIGTATMTVKVRRAGQSDWADIETFELTVDVAAPTNTYAEPTENDAFESLTVHAEKFDREPDGFEVWASDSQNGTYEMVDDVSPSGTESPWSMTFRHDGLAPHTTRWYQVRAYLVIESVKHFSDFTDSFSGRTDTGAFALNDVVEDDVDNIGTLVQDLTLEAPAGMSYGIAVTNVDEDYGIWQYREQDEDEWHEVDVLAPSVLEISYTGWAALTLNVDGFESWHFDSNSPDYELQSTLEDVFGAGKATGYFHDSGYRLEFDGDLRLDQIAWSITDPDCEYGDLAYGWLDDDGDHALYLTADSEARVRFIPSPNFSGTINDALTLHWWDGTEVGENAVNFSQTVIAGNDAPQATDVSYDTSRNINLQVDAPGLLDACSDPDGNALSIEPSNGPISTTFGEVIINADGSFLYTPIAGYVGSDSFQYLVRDDQGLAATATAWIGVGSLLADAAGNDLPTTDEDSSIELHVTRNRVDGQSAEYFRFTSDHGTFLRNGSPIYATSVIAYAEAADGVTFVPSDNYFGPANVVVQAGNLVGGSFVLVGSRTVLIEVTGVDDVPVILIAENLKFGISTTSAFSGANAIAVQDLDDEVVTVMVSVDGGRLIKHQTGEEVSQFSVTGTSAYVNFILQSSRFVAPATASTVQLAVTVADGSTTATSPAITATIHVVPTLTITGASHGESDSTPLMFTVTLSSASDQTVTVNWQRMNGSALAGSDFTGAATGTLTFAPGETTRTITFGIVDDDVYEGSQSFSVGLSNPINAVISAATASGVIIDNETLPTISIPNVVAWERNGTTTVSVSLSGKSDYGVFVNWSASSGTAIADEDWTAGEWIEELDENGDVIGGHWSYSGALFFAPGETTKSIVLNLLDDAIPEDAETINLAFDYRFATLNVSGSISRTLLIRDHNTAPEIVGPDMSLGVLPFNLTNPVGWSVGELVRMFGEAISDADGDLDELGMAVHTATVVGSGTWQYRISQAANWQNWPSLSTDYALVLSAQATIRYLPAGTDTGAATLLFYAWDQTDGLESGDHPIPVLIRGEESAFSYEGRELTLVVGTGNNPPEFVSGGDRTIWTYRNQLLNGTLPATADFENDPLRYRLKPERNTTHGTLVIHEDGTFTYQPDALFEGDDEFTYIVSDGWIGGEIEGTITLHVIKSADAKAHSYSVVAGNALMRDAATGLTMNSNATSGVQYSVALKSGHGPQHGSLDLSANGAFTYIPTGDYAGTDSFTYALTYNNATTEATVTIAVLSPGDAVNPKYDPTDDEANNPTADRKADQWAIKSTHVKTYNGLRQYDIEAGDVPHVRIIDTISIDLMLNEIAPTDAFVEVTWGIDRYNFNTPGSDHDYDERRQSYIANNRQVSISSGDLFNGDQKGDRLPSETVQIAVYGDGKVLLEVRTFHFQIDWPGGEIKHTGGLLTRLLNDETDLTFHFEVPTKLQRGAPIITYPSTSTPEAIRPFYPNGDPTDAFDEAAQTYKIEAEALPTTPGTYVYAFQYGGTYQEYIVEITTEWQVTFSLVGAEFESGTAMLGITIPPQLEGKYRIDIDWGDGNSGAPGKSISYVLESGHSYVLGHRYKQDSKHDWRDSLHPSGASVFMVNVQLYDQSGTEMEVRIFNAELNKTEPSPSSLNVSNLDPDFYMSYSDPEDDLTYAPAWLTDQEFDDCFDLEFRDWEGDTPEWDPVSQKYWSDDEDGNRVEVKPTYTYTATVWFATWVLDSGIFDELQYYPDNLLPAGPCEGTWLWQWTNDLKIESDHELSPAEKDDWNFSGYIVAGLDDNGELDGVGVSAEDGDGGTAYADLMYIAGFAPFDLTPPPRNRTVLLNAIALDAVAGETIKLADGSDLEEPAVIRFSRAVKESTANPDLGDEWMIVDGNDLPPRVTPSVMLGFS